MEPASPATPPAAGLRVLLVESNDLASGTSSASTKLIHGGLRYLEQYAFRLVREALGEREVLLRMAPHVIRPMRFVLPPLPGMRAPLLLRFGLFLYDWLGAAQFAAGRRAPSISRIIRSASRSSGCSATASNIPTARSTMRGWSCSTRSTPPSAAPTSAPVRVACASSGATNGNWCSIARGRREVVTARVLVNAAGPWIGEVAETVIRQPLKAPVRLIKGSHIVVRRRFDHDCGYIFQAADGRVVFALPFARRVHADRHHRRELRRRPQFAGADRRPRSLISATW